MQDHLVMMHTCDVIIHKPDAVRKFGEMCDWCRLTLGDKLETWAYEILPPHTDPWHVRFRFVHDQACVQFRVTWS